MKNETNNKGIHTNKKTINRIKFYCCGAIYDNQLLRSIEVLKTYLQIK